MAVSSKDMAPLVIKKDHGQLLIKSVLHYFDHLDHPNHYLLLHHGGVTPHLGPQRLQDPGPTKI